MNERLLQQHGDSILECVKKGLVTVPPVFPEDSVIKRFIPVKADGIKVNKLLLSKIGDWRKRTAASLKTDPELVLPKETVVKFVRELSHNRGVPVMFPGFGREKIDRYSGTIRRIFKQSGSY